MSVINGVNCIVDTNYILYKNVYTLNKNKELYNLKLLLASGFPKLITNLDEN